MRIFCIFILVTLFSGCSVKRHDYASVYWNSAYTQKFANQITTAFLASPFAKKNNYKYKFDRIINKTYDHINTKVLEKMIIQRLSQNGFIFVHKNADAIFEGKLRAIYQKNEITKDMYYQFALSLYDANTRDVVWSDYVQVRKLSKKPFFGW